MREIRSFNVKPLVRIYCACGCELYLQIDRCHYSADNTDEYLFKFIDPDFYSLKERIKLAFTRKKNYQPHGSIIRCDQYKDIINVLTKEFGKIPKGYPRFQYIKDDACWRIKITRYGEGTYKNEIQEELILDSVSNQIKTKSDKCEIDISPGLVSVNKPRLATILSPTFQTYCELLLEKQQLLEFVQILQYYRS